MVVTTNFTTIDAVIVVVYLVGSLAAGIFAHRYVGRLADYLVAGRTLKLHLGVATMIASELGLVTLMYMAQQGFLKGPAAMHIALAWFLAVLFIGMSGFVVTRLRETGVMTVPEYYGLRYNGLVRWIGGVILAASGILNMGIFLQVDAKFLLAVTGVQPISTVGFEAGPTLVWTMMAMMAIVLVYTVLGGMVSVVVTDLLQFIVLSLGMLIVTVVGVRAVGWEEPFNIAQVFLGEGSVDPSVDEQYGYAYVIWMLLLSVSAGCLWHSATLRALAAQSPTVARQVFAWSSIGFLARYAIPILWGVLAYAWFMRGAPELRGLLLYRDGSLLQANLADGSTVDVDTLYALPVFIGRTVPTILLGVVVAGMLAASMSTYSSYLLCWGAVITQDVVAPLVPGGLSSRARILLTRLWIVLIGAFLIGFGLFFYTPDVWKFLAGTGTIYLSGASAVVILGLYWPRASSAGATGALVVGLLGVLVPFRDQFSRAGWTGLADEQVLALITMGSSWATMIALSLIFPDRRARGPLFTDDKNGGGDATPQALGP